MPKNKKIRTKELFDHIKINKHGIYSTEEIRLIKEFDWLLNMEKVSPANVLDRILFKKFSTESDSAFRIGLINKILQHNSHLSIDDTLYLDFTSTPLMMQAAQGCSAICVRLLQSSVNPNPFFKDNKGKTILHLLVAKGHQRNDEEGADYEDQCPLFEAVLKHKDIQEHINDQDKYGQTALHYAAARRDLYYIKLLLSNGADPEKRDNFGRNFFDVVKLTEHERVNIIGSALHYPNEWNQTLNFKIAHFDNPDNLIGGEQAGNAIGEKKVYNLGYFCGRINKALFNQEPELVINYVHESLTDMSADIAMCVGKEHYKGVFFEKSKIDSSEKLETFQENIDKNLFN